jgi:hypothetical protein
MFRTALLPHPLIECWSAVITSGRAVSQAGPRTVHVAKTELAGCIRSVLESSRLKVPAELEFADALKRELGDFTVKVTPAGNQTFEAGAGQYDDLVMCVAIPIFLSTWLDSRQAPFIVGYTRVAAETIRPPRVMMGGWTPSSDRWAGAGQDRSGWRPGFGAISPAPRGGSRIFGDPNG